MTEAALTTEFYISTRSAPPDERARVLKYGQTFATFNRFGDIVTEGLGEEGIFHHGTRYLSRFKLLVGGHDPLLLSSTISADNLLFAGDLSNVVVSFRRLCRPPCSFVDLGENYAGNLPISQCLIACNHLEIN